MVKKVNTEKCFYGSPTFKLLEEVDKIAFGLESKWGQGVLFLTAGKTVMEKFERAQDRMVDAINGGDYDTCKAACENVKRGWAKLEQIALEGGYDKKPNYLKLVNGDFEWWLVKDRIDAGLLAARYPQKANAIVTHEECAKILSKDGDRLINVPKGEFSRIMTEPSNMGDIIQDLIPF